MQGVPRGHHATHFFQAGIEQHQPEPGRYDVIWLQWAALYLTDGEREAAQAAVVLACGPGACSPPGPPHPPHPLTKLAHPPCTHPTPADLEAFLQRSVAALRPGGVLFVKENVCDRGFVVDKSDASVTRCALKKRRCWGGACCGGWGGALRSVLNWRHPLSPLGPPTARRSHQYYVQLFDKAGLRLTHTALQKDFPKVAGSSGCLLACFLLQGTPASAL